MLELHVIRRAIIGFKAKELWIQFTFGFSSHLGLLAVLLCASYKISLIFKLPHFADEKIKANFQPWCKENIPYV